MRQNFIEENNFTCWLAALASALIRDFFGTVREL